MAADKSPPICFGCRPTDAKRVNNKPMVDHMMKNGPHRLMSMIADYAAKGPSGRAL
jgi:hypothetical protein